MSNLPYSQKIKDRYAKFQILKTPGIIPFINKIKILFFKEYVIFSVMFLMAFSVSVRVVLYAVRAYLEGIRPKI